MSNRQDRDLDDEIKAHLDMAERDRIERGESADAARAHTRREFGNVLLVKETTRGMWGGLWLERLWQDVGYGLRLLRRNPAFTALALACIGLGVGVTTTIFGAVNALLLQPLPYPDARELVVVHSRNAARNVARSSVSWPDMLAWRDDSRAFSEIGLWSPKIVQLADPGLDMERVGGAEISPSLLSVFRISPLIGRNFLESDQQYGNDHKVLLSHGLWQRRYGGDRAIVGRMIRLGSPPIPIQQYEVVGVLPPHVSFPEGAEAWLPAQIDIDQYAANGSRHFYGAIGRLAPGKSILDAQRGLDAIAARLQAAYPKAQAGWDAVASSLRDELVGDLRDPIVLFQGAALLVLLIACANMASLMLARGGARLREMGVRTALGASRGRLTRQLLTESLLLGLSGGAIGVSLAALGIGLLSATLPVGVPEFVTIAIDRDVLMFALVASVASGVLFGLLPALRARQIAPVAALGGSGRETTAPAMGRSRQIFASIQIGTSLVLVIGAALLAESRYKLMRELGYDRAGILWVSVPTPPDRYEGPPREVFYRTLESRLATLPGVDVIGRAAATAPLGNPGRIRPMTVSVDGRPGSADNTSEALVHEVTPDYFRAIGAPVVRGRGFTSADRPTSENSPVFSAVVNETFARQFYPGQEAVGREVVSDIPGASNLGKRRFTIVGVVRNFRQERPPRPIPPAMYVYVPFGMSNTSLVLRTRLADPRDLATDIRAIVRQIDPAVHVAVLQTFDEALARGLWRERAYERVVGIFAGLALVLAIIGVYGVVSFVVSQRTREFGVRIALGADPRAIFGHVLAHALRPTLAGLAAGLAAALLLTRLLAGVLYDIRPTDPITFAGVVIALGATAMLAGCVPARRAARVDPVQTLRAE